MKDALLHIFLPRGTNNHRAKFLHHSSLLLISVLILGVALLTSYSSNHRPDVLGISSNITSSDLLSLTNQKRQEQGLPSLVLNEKLNAAAEQKARDMFAKDYWAHNGPDGTTPWVFVKSSGYDYLYAGENLARGFTNSPEVVAAWMASPGHRQNILSGDYQDVGFAVIDGNLTGDETVLVVQMFGKTKDAPVEVATASDAAPKPQVQEVVIQDLRPVSQETNVASVKSTPLLDSQIFSKTSSILILGILITILAVDAFIIQRKKIVRILSHNLDHAMFLFIVLIVVFLVGRGMIL